MTTSREKSCNKHRLARGLGLQPRHPGGRRAGHLAQAHAARRAVVAVRVERLREGHEAAARGPAHAHAHARALSHDHDLPQALGARVVNLSSHIRNYNGFWKKLVEVN